MNQSTFAIPTTKRERVRRLRKLLKILDAIPDDEFDMDYWGRRNSQCGTTACLLGSAAVDPFFKKLGLRMTLLRWYDEETLRPVRVIIRDLRRLPMGGDADVHLLPATKQRVSCISSDTPAGTEAGAALLGIEQDEANLLFLPGYYPTMPNKETFRAAVRGRLVDLIEKYSAPTRKRAA